jgi:membrane-bound lytic murein transglycosylase B
VADIKSEDMKNLRSGFIGLVILLILLLGGAGRAWAQSDQTQSLEAQRTQLEQQLQAVEAQIAQNQKSLVTLQSQKNTLANKLKQLAIARAGIQLKIKQISLKLDESVVQLTQTQQQIDQNQQQVASLQNHLSAVITQLWQARQSSLFNLLLTVNNFSDFYNALHNLATLVDDLGHLQQSLQLAQTKLVANQQVLADQQEQQKNFFTIVNLQNSQVTQNIQDQNTLLTQTKGKEANYQKLLKQNQAQAAAIRNRIYSLVDVAANQQITFGQAVTIAQATSLQTGVRPALLLAILTQESNLGRNVGTCNRKGDPSSKSWKVIMKPTRDQVPFAQITKALGLDTDITPVSCPMHDSSGAQIGWGGAMGPAQFIPSTWLGYQSQIAAITGRGANPWNIKDAFLAAALKLKADGATAAGGEWAAAMRYFSGSTNPAYSFYGDNVIATATKYQADIDQLNGK